MRGFAQERSIGRICDSQGSVKAATYGKDHSAFMGRINARGAQSLVREHTEWDDKVD